MWQQGLAYFNKDVHLCVASERPAHLSVTIASASLNTSFEYTAAAWKKHSYLRKCRSEMPLEMPIQQYFSWQTLVLNITFQQLCDPGPCGVQELWASCKNWNSFNHTSLCTLLLSCLVFPCCWMMIFGRYSNPNYCCTVLSCLHCSWSKCQIICLSLCCFCLKFLSLDSSGLWEKKNNNPVLSLSSSLGPYVVLSVTD